MNGSSDIAHLFEQFGGDARQYHEITRDRQASVSRARWALLSSLDAGQAPAIPDVSHDAAGTAPPAFEPLPRTAPAPSAIAPAAPLSLAPVAAPAPAVAPIVAPVPAAPAPAPAQVAAGGDLQGLFGRLSRQGPEPAKTPTGTLSFLRRLERP